MAPGPFGTFETGANEEREHARVRLVAEHTGVVPGQVAYLGVTFEIDDGWHLYWHGRNDTGFPIDIALDLPRGFKQLETLHPVPKRYISPGAILDHVYEDSVTLIVPIRVPEDARPGSVLRVEGRADWLVCNEVCIPGSGSLAIDLPVVGTTSEREKSRDASLFSAARAQLPKQNKDMKAPPHVRWEGEHLLIEAPEGGWIEFYPYSKSAEIQHPIGSQTSNTGVLQLATDAHETGKPVHGVVAWKVRDRETGGLVQHQTVVRVEPGGKIDP